MKFPFVEDNLIQTNCTLTTIKFDSEPVSKRRLKMVEGRMATIEMENVRLALIFSVVSIDNCALPQIVD